MTLLSLLGHQFYVMLPQIIKAGVLISCIGPLLIGFSPFYDDLHQDKVEETLDLVHEGLNSVDDEQTRH